MPDGSHQQIANLRTDVLGKIIGKAGVNITLIKQKSGANVSVLKDAVPNTSGYTKVIMVGAAADVYLATQMIQEILVNGPSKLSSLPDKPQSGAPGYPQIAQPAAYKAPPAAYPNYADPAASQFGAQPQYVQPQYAAQPAPGAQQQYGITQTTVVLNTWIFY
jgi:negative regulator of sigma E activity